MSSKQEPGHWDHDSFADEAAPNKQRGEHRQKNLLFLAGFRKMKIIKSRHVWKYQIKSDSGPFAQLLYDTFNNKIGYFNIIVQHSEGPPDQLT